jgi:intracellular sulfur oxidation DsrE/DsrF family protein
MKQSLKVAALAVFAFILTGTAQAEDDGMLVPGFPAGRDLPGATLSPDPNTEYKVVFDLVVEDEDLDDPYPFLAPIAIYVNTLGKFGVPRENRHISIVLHRGSGLIGLTNEAFRERHDGKDNPNIELIQKLHAAGVTFHQCGQGVLARELEKDDLLPEIQIDYWALTTLIELGRQGYVKIGG